MVIMLCSIDSNNGVHPALSGISKSTECSMSFWITSLCPFSMAWWAAVPPELSYFKLFTPFSSKYLTISILPPLAAYMSAVHPLGEVSSKLAPPFSIRILINSKSPLIAAQFKGVRPLWSLQSISKGSGVSPAYELSIRTVASSVCPWMQLSNKQVCPCSSWRFISDPQPIRNLTMLTSDFEFQHAKCSGVCN